MKQERYGTWIYKKMTENSEVKLPPVNPILNGEGWDNHEDSFEETLRREMLKYKGLYHLLQEDQKELNKSYYKVLERNKELIEFNQLLQESNRKLLKEKM